MTRRLTLICFLFGIFGAAFAQSPSVVLPDPKIDETAQAAKHHEKVVLAGGCFWGIQAVFEHVKGVAKATAGYSGGTVRDPSYEDVSSGTTGHAESVEVIYDPSEVTFGKLLKVFFSVAHDPTQLNRQGPDTGTQYRSAIFFENRDQQRIAQAYVDQLTKAAVFSGPIVTKIEPFRGFFEAEGYHQDYLVHNPNSRYIQYYDLPKLANLKQEFPGLFVEYGKAK